MTPRPGRGRGDWQSLALGLVIGVSLAAVVVGGIIGFTMLGSAAPAASSASTLPRTDATTGPSGTRPPLQTVVALGSLPVNPASPVASSGVASALAPTAAATTGVPSTPATSPRLAVIDATLLAILPELVAGHPVVEFPEAERQAVVDPDLGRNVARLATAFVGDQGGANWAYTAVVDVRPEAQSDAFYRDWQESFDQSACAQAGGVTGHTTVKIGGRDVERTACGAGVRTFHVRVPGTGLLISISELGAGKFGEAELAGLRT